MATPAVESPLVSIGLPVFNGERYLQLAAESLLGQTYTNIELVISDNASDDATEAICRDLQRYDSRVKYERLASNIGAVPNHNKVLERSTGQFFMWSSHDDLWHPSYVEKCMNLLMLNANAVVAYSSTGYIDDSGSLISVLECDNSLQQDRPEQRWAQMIDLDGIIEPVYGVIRMQTLREVGPMPMHPACDKVVFAGLALRGRIVRVQELLYFRRQHVNRSVRVYPRLRDRYTWVKPVTDGGCPQPYVEFLVLMTKVVVTSPLPLRDKVCCFRALGSWTRQYWREILSDFSPDRVSGMSNIKRTASGRVRRMSRYAFLTEWDIDSPGGVNQVVANLYQQARDNGPFRPILLVDSWNCRMPRVGRRNGRATVWFSHRPPWTREGQFWGTLVFIVTLPWNLFLIARLSKRLSLCIVNAHFPGMSSVVWLLARKMGLYDGKVILSLHGRDVRNCAQCNPVERWLWDWLLRNADRVIACSQGLADDAMKLFPRSATRLSVVYNGVDADALRKAVGEGAKTMPAIPEGRPLLVNLATFEYKKGQDILLEAMYRLRDQWPRMALVIAGRSGDGEVIARLEQDIVRLGLTGRVALLRDLPHEQALALLARGDLFVLPSRNEGFAIALLEAGALGKPIVAADVCGVAELLVDGEDGVIVPPEDPQALAEAIVRELGDATGAARNAKNLRYKVETSFSWHRAWAEYQAIIQQC